MVPGAFHHLEPLPVFDKVVPALLPLLHECDEILWQINGPISVARSEDAMDEAASTECLKLLLSYLHLFRSSGR
jgi:hypothetical protein